MTPQTTDRRNLNGVKSSIDMYRTIGGERFVSWSAGDATKETAALYRKRGIRARFIAGELFIHHEDTERAGDVDRDHFEGGR